MQASPSGLTTFSSDPPQIKNVEFSVGIGSHPYLSDHGFADMIVLPGSFYIASALQIHRAMSPAIQQVLQNIRFQNPLIISEQDSVIEVQAENKEGKLWEYVFSGAGEIASKNNTVLARIEIAGGLTGREQSASEFSIPEFKAHAAFIAETTEFYRRLRQNGNQYGPRFQNVSEIWRAGDEVLGRFSVASSSSQTQQALDPIVLDAVTQILATFTIDSGLTCILKSIDRIDLRDTNFPDTLWVHAMRRTDAHAGDKELVGDIHVFDESGKVYLELAGVAFAFLDRVGAAGVKTGNRMEICIASTFTAEPVEDALKFWGDQFGVSTEIRFAPYNQIFQQLLDADSVFNNNTSGINAILLNLEDWKDQQTQLKLDRQTAERCFSGRSRYVLPNGLEIAHLNRYETDYVYGEIFRDECYLRHGININDGDTIIDIGANIGLFSLFALSRAPSANIYAFEPAPTVYEVLKANCDAYGPNVRCFQRGVSDCAKSAEFTFYENSSVFSGVHSNESEDRAAVEEIARNMLTAATGDDSYESFVHELTAERLRPRTYQCQLISVSDIIRENRLEKIQLLKIDAEKSELEILRGIEDQHWPLIDQIVVEVHDRTQRLVKQIEQLLADKGYRCAIEQERLLTNSGLFNVYAVRPERTPLRKTTSSLENNTDEFCLALKSFMAQSAVPMVLCLCPRSPESKKRVEVNETMNAAEEDLLSRVNKLPNVLTISSQSILRRYPLSEYHDPHGDQLGHVPYTAEGYVALGTMLFQTIAQLESKPLKVIVLDCDNTLWEGVCGEDGPLGLQIDDSHRLLQQFVVDRMRAGLLLCVCSKNNEKDVLEVFDQRQDMILKREHLVSSRINWDRKSDNIKALAEELNLGLDSFLFIDNDAVECADVRINCPDVLTLQLPRESTAIPSFLNGIWAWGGASSTREDQRRTEMYRQNIQREEFRERTISLKDFLDGLQLRIELSAPTEDQLARVAQLTLRTNQFNFTTIRRTENEIRDWLEKENRECAVASVSDRFGDYGLVGVLLYEKSTKKLKVDTFLLSCRVLGRGVEHYLWSMLGREAERDGIEFIELSYAPTEKNSPALEFIRSLNATDVQTGENGELCVKLQAAMVARLQYDPDKRSRSEKSPREIKQKSVGAPGSRWSNFNRSEVFQKICDELSDIDQIAKAVDDFRYEKGTPESGDEGVPTNTLEQSISGLWKKVLARRQIGLNDNFFEVGGTSLKAVQLISLIQKELKRTVSITTLFECPTVKLLAAKLGNTADNGENGTDAAQARKRGHERRYRKVTRATA